MEVAWLLQVLRKARTLSSVSDMSDHYKGSTQVQCGLGVPCWALRRVVVLYQEEESLGVVRHT